MKFETGSYGAIGAGKAGGQPTSAMFYQIGTNSSARETNPEFYRGGLKRVVDTALILLSAPFLLPIVAVLVALIWIDGGRPFYSQARVGLGGRVFRMWKFRSMVHNADALLAEYLSQNPEALREWNSMQKLRMDPRVTPIGRFIRRTSLDELPQLWNVLMGDMSLVGPRPMLVEQKVLYPGVAYYRVRPGLTGPWQTSKRNESSFADRVEFDDLYEGSVSLRNDAVLIMKTFKSVLQGTGC